MCEWVDICPGTWESINNAACKVAMNFWLPIEEALDWVWLDFLRLLQLEDAAKDWMNWYQMMDI